MSSTVGASPSMQGSWEPDFFVADWRVRPSLGRLERNGTATSVEPRSMQVLTCLARHAPGVVSKQRLMREVWGEVFVTDEVMTHAVWGLRKAFGDEAKNPRYIETLPRKGYRLMAEVARGAAQELLTAGARVANYEILESVAGGAMGEVYRAKDLRLGRTVALKFLPSDLCRDPGAQKRFMREAQAVAQLDHPNVATIYDIGETEGGRMFLALAFYEGETLQQKLERGPLPIPEAVGIARQIAKGLAAAHRRQIVHRDIKPANLVVLPDGTIKILDFGLAKVTGATTLPRLGSSPGTPAYKSPEQTRGEKTDPRSDLWALGVVLYEMVTGRVPFGGEYEQAVIYAILNQPLSPLDHLPAELAAVIERALAKEAAARYLTVEEMEADLGGVLGEGAHQTMANPRRWSDLRAREHRRVLRPLRRKWRLIVLCTLVVLGVGVASGLWYKIAQVKQLVEQGDKLEWRGDTEDALGNAEQAYRRALKLEPNNPVIMAHLAALLARKQVQLPPKEERLAEIRRLTDRAVELGPDHPLPWVARANLLLLENKPKDAELAARQAIAVDPKLDRGYTVLGEALIQQGELDRGLSVIRRGIEVGQGDLRARLILGVRLKEASRYNEAAAELQEVLDLEPDNPIALQNLGEIYLEMGRYSDALPLLRKVYQETGDERSANSLGDLYSEMGQDREAIRYYVEAYNLKRHPITARNLAESYDKVGEADLASRWYKTALESFDLRLKQGGSRAYLLNSRSFCAAKLGRFDEAFVNIEEAMRLKPSENRFLVRAAQVYLLAGQRQKAFEYLRQAVQAGVSRDDIRSDFVFRSLLDDPKFRAILEGD